MKKSDIFNSTYTLEGYSNYREYQCDILCDKWSNQMEYGEYTVFYNEIDNFYNFYCIDKNGDETKDSQLAGVRAFDLVIDDYEMSKFGHDAYYGISKSDF